MVEYELQADNKCVNREDIILVSEIIINSRYCKKHAPKAQFR